MTICDFKGGCVAHAHFGFLRCGKTRCIEHKDPNMIDLDEYCSFGSCSSKAVYARIGNEKELFCLKHRAEDMVNVKCRKCSHEGCRTRPSFGREQDGKILVCKEHKTPDMINLTLKRCFYEGCRIGASFGKKEDAQ